MGEFAYQARGTDGARRSGVISAGDAREAAENLRGQGLYVISLEAHRSLGTLVRAAQHHRRAGRRLQARDLALFFRQFVTVLRAGIPILDALTTIARQADNAFLRQTLQQMAADLRGGVSLSEACERRGNAFPDMVASMVRAGELSGALDDVSDRLATHFEREDSVARKVRSAVTYPTVVLVVAVFIVIFLMTFVIPNFANFFSGFGASLPWSTLAILRLSQFIRRWLWLFALLVLAALIPLRRYLATDRGALAWDRRVISLPYFGQLILKRIVGRTARTLATLLAGGLPMLAALESARQVAGNRAVAAAIAACQTAVSAGGALSVPLRESGLFPPMVAEMVATGEEAGAIDSMLTKVADYYDAEVDATLSRLTGMIEPALIVLLGVIVGAVVLSVVWPMFDILQRL
ncbi:MAG: type II secretion system F family protein [Chloroflexota bacterium]